MRRWILRKNIVWNEVRLLSVFMDILCFQSKVEANPKVTVKDWKEEWIPLIESNDEDDRVTYGVVMKMIELLMVW